MDLAIYDLKAFMYIVILSKLRQAEEIFSQLYKWELQLSHVPKELFISIPLFSLFHDARLTTP